MLLVGLFPILYALVVSVQNVTMFDQDYSWYGFVWYELLFEDERFWESLWHTAIITAIALPLELIIGLLVARMFLSDMRFKPIFIAILILPSVVCPVVVGAIWRLMFDTRYGPITHGPLRVARIPGGDHLGGRAQLGLPRHPHRRGVAVVPLHVPHPARRALQRRHRPHRRRGD